MENNNDYLSCVSLRFVEDFKLYSEKSFENAITAVEEVGKYIYDCDREYSMLICTDAQGHPICVNIIGIGSSLESPMCAREILRILALSGACAFILMHNHPGAVAKSLKPSSRDNDVVDRMVQLSRLTGITLLDSIIVAKDNGKPVYFSYREKQKKRLNSFGKVVQEFLGEFKINKEDFPDLPPVMEGWEKESIFLTAYTEEELREILDSDDIKKFDIYN